MTYHVRLFSKSNRNETTVDGGLVLAPDPVKNRALVKHVAPQTPEPVPGTRRSFIESPLKPIIANVNARAISPRAVQTLSQDLYAGGVLTWEEHVEMSFQPDIHPDFMRTIGALTGEKPFPDLPRDFIEIWEHRLEFERRQDNEGPERDHALYILGVLRRIQSFTDRKTSSA